MSVKLAIIIPTYKHNVLVIEAISSALTQKFNSDFAIIMVNDGCPFPETRLIGTSFAQSHRNCFHYVERRNGGLSAARNTGISYAMKTFNDLEVIYLLDADNRLEPNALQNAYDFMKQNDLDWVYPSINMFGLNEQFSFPGKYSKLIHKDQNLCEAGSLIKTSIFKAGLFFDEKMRKGYEDWEFWLNCAFNGFRGEYLENFGFRYRKRAESMLSSSHSKDKEIRDYIKSKHSKEYSPSTLLSQLYDEFPEVCIVDITDNAAYILYAADKQEKLNIEELKEKIWASVLNPERFHMPTYMVFCNNYQQIRQSTEKVFTCMLHMLIEKLDLSNKVFSSINILDSSALNRSTQFQSGYMLSPRLIAFKADLVKSVLKDPQTMWLDSIKNKESELGEFCEIVNVTEKEYLLETEVMQLSHVTNFLQVLRDEEYRVSSACNFEWRTVPHDRSIYPREVVKKLTEQNTIPLYEVSKQSQRGKNIGFALPVASFGGVEKVTYQVARVLKSKGWVPHLFIVNTNEVDLPKECHSIFENIFYLDVDCQSNWNKKSSYAGTGLPSMSYEEKNKLVKSLLWLDSLVICHAWQLYPAISELKKFNVKLYSHQHLADISSSGRTLGNPFIALAYEHVLDGVLTCSNKLARWFVSQGVPMSKVIPVANGPGLTIENDDILRSYKAKQDRAVEPLRVMYFGRLDVQKGYDRLLEIYHKTKGYENIEWRVVGKEIISDTQTRELDDVIEPPKFDSKSILECYEWADVLLLPSKYEGLPLVIKEAQLMGVCVIATDVGAVSEAIDNGLTGYVYPEQEYVLNSIEFLKKNALNKKLLDEIQTACHRKHEKILSTWNDSVSLFESHLTS